MILPFSARGARCSPDQPAPDARRGRRIRILAAILAPATAVALFSGCSGDSARSADTPLPAAKVRVTGVKAESLPVLTEATGTVRPVRRASLSAKIMGTIDEIPVTLGQRVARGEILVKISAGEISARVARARSDINAASRDLERERTLLTKGASTPDTVKSLEDRFAATGAMLKEAEVMLGYAVIHAPFDGVIARKFANAGDLASPGSPLLEIEELVNFEIEASLPDSAASRLAKGTGLDVHIPAADLRFTATVTEISSAADPQARTVPVKLAVPAGLAVRSGQFARIHVPGPSLPALLVPRNAVSSFGQMERVFVAGADNRAVLRLVKTGAQRGERVEILSGVQAGDRVIVAPPSTLRDSQPLEILP